MKVAVSIPNATFVDADRLAGNLKMTRSALYARALDAFLASHGRDDITSAMNAVIDEVGNEPDPFVQAAARRVLERVEW